MINLKFFIQILSSHANLKFKFILRLPKHGLENEKEVWKMSELPYVETSFLEGGQDLGLIYTYADILKCIFLARGKWPWHVKIRWRTTFSNHDLLLKFGE